ncbi:hypothetical protein J3R30DRAFT_3438780 [Lentinula aciculospora]|uniref:Uncharacterized protein n=1 Tax=Lentinula aciculospora TaxID=153920 RepID=A0A9W9AN26_9AGAR|nr:hypothetical protein J3R30DRAFT_3438780 [Lentinula aciculospora]
MILPAFLSRYLQQLWADKDRSYKLKDAVYLFILFSSSELHPNMCLLAFVFLTTFIAPAYCGYCFENCANSTSINPSTMIIIFVTIAAVIIALSFIFALVRYQRIKQFQRDIVQNAAFGASTIPTSYILPTQPGLMYHSLHHHAHHQHAHNDVNIMSMQNMQTAGMMGAGVT